MRNPVIEEAIMATPDDPAAYLIYGDWLQAQGDPRGHLIAAHAVFELDPDDRSAKARADTLLAANHRELLGIEAPAVPHLGLAWFYGFLRSIECGHFSGISDLRAVLDSESARFLRSISFGATGPVPELESLLVFRRTLERFRAPGWKHQVTADDVRVLGELTQLRELLVSGTDLSDDDLEPLARLKNLRWLVVGGHKFTDRSFHHLRDLRIETLVFDESSKDLTRAGIAIVANWPLVVLNAIASFSDESIMPLAGHPSLRTLCGRRSTLTTHGLEALRDIALTRLDLPQSLLSRDGIKHLPTTLRYLDLDGVGTIDDSSAEHFATMTDLAHLILNESTELSAQGIESLAALSQLDTLDLNACALSDDDVSALRGRPLRQLGLYDNRVTSAVIGTVMSMPNLESLDLGVSAITASDIDRLAEHPTLKRVGVCSVESDVLTRARAIGHWSIQTRNRLELLPARNNAS